jgi:hypothetical protein
MKEARNGRYFECIKTICFYTLSGAKVAKVLLWYFVDFAYPAFISDLFHKQRHSLSINMRTPPSIKTIKHKQKQHFVMSEASN